MAKYGKQFKREIIPEWQNHYISYKKLKKVIHQISREPKILSGQIFSENSKEAELNIESEGMKQRISSRLSENLELDGKYRNRLHFLDFSAEFYDTMDMEIKKFYLFYSTLERELYLQINTHLHKRIKYHNFLINDINKELEQLAKISHLTASFCKYINDNIIAIKKILKKFDKKFKSFCGDMTIKYLKNKLEEQNSDLNYILQFKIIDEVNVLIDDLSKELLKRFYQVLKNKTAIAKERENLNNYANNITNNSENSSAFRDPLLDGNPSNLSIAYFNKDFHDDQNDLKRKIKSKFLEIRQYLSQIDEQSTFRAKIKNLNFYVNNGFTILNNHVKLLHSEANKSILIHQEEEELIKIFLSTGNKEILTKETYRSLSTENKINIIQCFLHTYLYMSIYSICISTNFLYLREMGFSPVYSGLLLGLTHLGAIISTSILSKWIKCTYKWPMIISVIFFMLGSLLYGAAYSCGSNSILMIGLGRFIIGLGSIRPINRGYLIQFLPKNLITIYSDYYFVAGLIGLASGPLLSMLAIYFDEFVLFDTIYFNIFTYPAWFSFLQSLLMLIIVICFYTEPLSIQFHLLEEEKEADLVITKEDKKMINDIEKKLNEINIENQFSDTNLVACNIKLITSKQQKEFSYVKKCFLVLLLILFFSRVTNESILTIFPYYVYGDEVGEETNFHKLVTINVILMFSFLSVIPVYFLFKKFRKSYTRERRYLIYLLIFALINTIFTIDYIFDSKIKFCVCFFVLVNTMYLIETFNSSLISKIIPSNWKIGRLSFGSFISLVATFGRILGSSMQTISAGIVGESNIVLLTYSFLSSCFLLLIIGFAMNYTEMRMKAISRIMKNQSNNIM